MDIANFYQMLGKRIKEIRESRGFSQELLAEKSGISTDYLGKIEVNINNPGLIALYKIIRGLDITFEEFFKGIK